MKTKLDLVRAGRLAVVLFAGHLLSLSTARAQAAITPLARAEKDSSSTVLLTPFEVVADTDNGLLSTNSVSATKGNTPIKEIPQNVYILNQEFLQAQIPFDLNDMLRYAPGIAVDGDYRNETYQMRGFDGGLPLQNGISISRTFPTEQGAVNRIEVVQGPAAVLYGANGGMGGTLNRTTQMPSFKPAESLSLSYRNDRENVRVVYTKSGALNDSKRLAYQLTAIVQHSEGFQDFTKLNRQYLRPALTWKISDQTFLAIEPEITLQRQNIGYRYDYFDKNPTGRIIRMPDSTNPAESYWFSSARKYSTMLTLSHRFNPAWTFRWSAFLTDNNLNEDDPRIGDRLLTGTNQTVARTAADAANGQPLGYVQQQERYVGNYYSQADLLGGFKTGPISHKLAVGIEYKVDTGVTHQRRSTTGLGGTANSTFNMITKSYGVEAYPSFWPTYNHNLGYTFTKAAYTSDQVSLFNNRLHLLGGLRFVGTQGTNRDRRRQDAENALALRQGRTPADTNQRALSKAAPIWRYGGVIEVTRSVSAYASYSEFFSPRTTFNNLGERYPHSYGTQKDMGIKTSLYEGRVTLTLSHYDLRQINNILNFPTGQFGPRGETSLADGAVQSKGTDLNGVISFGNFQLMPGYSILKKITLVGSLTNAAANGVEIGTVPKYNTKMFGMYKFKTGPAKGLSVNLGLIHLSNRALGSYQNIPETLPGYSIWGGGSSYPLSRQWSVTARVDNIRDTRYYVSGNTVRALLGPPRTLSFSIQYTK